MPPFVAQRHRKETDKKEVKKVTNYEVSILVAAKKSKLSFEELNLLTLNDFFDYMDLFIGVENEGAAREATQEDIDLFYSSM